MGCFSTNIQAAPQRDYAQETKDTLQTQINLAPQLYASEAQYQPLYTQLALQNANMALNGGNGTPGMLDLYKNSIYPTMDQISAQSNSTQRAADIADVAKLGPQMQEALRQSNPQLFEALAKAQAMGGTSANAAQDRLAGALGGPNYVNLQSQNIAAQNVSAPSSLNYNQVQAGNYSPVSVQNVSAGDPITAERIAAERIRAGNIQGGQLQQMLTNQALQSGQQSPLSQALQAQGLAMAQSNGQLTPQEMRDATQATRAAYAARGMGLSDQAVMGEVQNRLVNQRQRQMENLGMAQNINSQLLGETAANRGFAQSALSQNVDVQSKNIANQLAAAQANQGTGLQAALANQSTNLQAQQYTADNSLRAQLANQQANLQAALQAQNLTAGQSMQAQMANQQAALNAGQYLGDASLRAQLANQQANLGAQSTNASNYLQANQFNGQLNQQAQQNWIQNLGQLAQLQNQGTAADRAYAAQLVGLQQAVTGDPFAAILGRSSQGFAAGQGAYGQAAGTVNGAGPALFNPESSYANNIYGGNQQATNAANIAQAQVNGGLLGGMMNMTGMVGAAAIKCWVAREVYGEENPQWRRFRTWMITRSPDWFRNLYISHGERFASFIRNKPRIKAVIRRWMDARIATLGH